MRDIAVLSGAHFLVDCGCACLFASCFRDVPGRAELLLLYNFCAFALQMPIGVLFDRYGHGGFWAKIGCMLIAVALLGGPMQLPTVRMCLAGVGNALFHAGGGVEVMHRSKKFGALGIFVSPGALGLYLGMLLTGWTRLVLALALGGIGFLFPDESRRVNAPPMPKQTIFLLAGLFLVVVLRSWLGMNAQLSWRVGLFALFAAVATALGKALGGLAADRWDARSVGLASLLLAAICYLFAGFAGAGLLAVLLFQMTMPLTLWAAAKLTGQPGFAFGLLTFGLFVGFLPTGLEWQLTAQPGLVPAAVCVASLLLLLPGLHRAVKRV